MQFTLYDLRHTFASRLLAAGIPVVEVSAWMGHAIRAGGHEITNTTTRVYAHATGEWRAVALAELASLMHESQRRIRERRGLSPSARRATMRRSERSATSSTRSRSNSGRCDACGLERSDATRKKVTRK